MHYELGINPEGIDAITHILRRLDGLEAKLKSLRGRLDRYEQEWNDG